MGLIFAIVATLFIVIIHELYSPIISAGSTRKESDYAAA